MAHQVLLVFTQQGDIALKEMKKLTGLNSERAVINNALRRYYKHLKSFPENLSQTNSFVSKSKKE